MARVRVGPHLPAPAAAVRGGRARIVDREHPRPVRLDQGTGGRAKRGGAPARRGAQSRRRPLARPRVQRLPRPGPRPPGRRGRRRGAAGWGAGSTGSRLVTGSTDLHVRLERALAELTGQPRALVFSSGYLANLGAVVALSGPGALVVSDAHNHASLVDACRLARARVVVVPHLDVDAVAATLAGRREERALVVTDGVFSVDGELAALRRPRGGVRGRGRGAARRRGARARCRRARRSRRRRRSGAGRAPRCGPDGHALQVAGSPGWRRARVCRRHRPHRRHGSYVHLRHRARPVERRGRPGGHRRAARGPEAARPRPSAGRRSCTTWPGPPASRSASRRQPSSGSAWGRPSKRSLPRRRCSRLAYGWVASGHLRYRTGSPGSA